VHFFLIPFEQHRTFTTEYALTDLRISAQLNLPFAKTRAFQAFSAKWKMKLKITPSFHSH